MFRFIRYVSLEGLQVFTLLILAGIPYIVWASSQTYAAELTNRSVTVSSAEPSATASDFIQATLGSVDPIGSIVFQYCSNSPLISDVCTAPAGLSLSGVALTAQSGNTGFTLDTVDSTNNSIVITRTATPALAVASSYTFSNIVNPSTANQTTFIRISTYSSVDGSGAYVDQGAVAFSTAVNLVVGAYIPPFLNLCVGITVTSNCSSASGTFIDMGILGPQITGVATSQIAAATNSVNGYVLYILGSTLTSGNNIIPSNNTPASSTKGLGQFGLNLRQNTSPGIGQDPSGVGTATPSPGYDTPNLFTFVPGTQIASSPLSTDFNKMTVSYITNVDSTQPAGIYDTTLTYLASTQF